MSLRVDELQSELSPLLERGPNPGNLPGVARWKVRRNVETRRSPYSASTSIQEQTEAVGSHDRRGGCMIWNWSNAVAILNNGPDKPSDAFSNRN
jgi:hypothetical protein